MQLIWDEIWYSQEQGIYYARVHEVLDPNPGEMVHNYAHAHFSLALLGVTWQDLTTKSLPDLVGETTTIIGGSGINVLKKNDFGEHIAAGDRQDGVMFVEARGGNDTVSGTVNGDWLDGGEGDDLIQNWEMP